MSKKLTTEFIRADFEKEDYKLLSKEYTGAHHKLKFICPNGHKGSISWANWRQGKRCRKCADDNHSKLMSEKYSNGKGKWSKYYSYKLPSSKTVRIQGYEAQTLDWFLKNKNWSEKDLQVNKIKPVRYVYESKTHRYVPDLLVISRDWIVETKSNYHFRQQYFKNMSKKDGCVKKGYKFSFFIYDNRKNMTRIDFKPKQKPLFFT